MGRCAAGEGESGGMGVFFAQVVGRWDGTAAVGCDRLEWSIDLLCAS